MLTQVIPAGTVSGDDQIMLAIVAVLGTLIATFAYVVRNGGYARTAAQQSMQTNAAVNHTEYGEHRLYDVVKRIEQKQDEFDRKWGNLPSEMGDAVGLVELIHGMDKRIVELQGQLAEHVAWEMAVKYPKEDT